MRRWLLKHLGVLGALNIAEYHILNRIKKLGLPSDKMDDIADIIMDELSHIRRT